MICPACRSTNVGGDACYDCGAVWNLAGPDPAFRREDSALDEDDRDFEQIIADRWEHDFDEDAAQDRYDRSVYGP